MSEQRTGMTATTEKPELPEFLTVDEVAGILRIGRTNANTLLWTGAIPSMKLKRRRLVRRADLDRFIAEHFDPTGEAGREARKA